MKHKSIKSILFTVILFIFVYTVSNAQYKPGSSYDSEQDSIECIMMLSTYKEYVLKKYYEDAYEPWLKAFHNCPASVSYLYIDGVKIYKHYIRKTKNPEKRDQYVDSLMGVYNQRIKYFNEEGYVRGRQGIDLFNYKQRDVESLKQAYQYLSTSLELEQNKTESAVVNAFMVATKVIYQRGIIEDKEVIENFITSMDILEAQRDDALSRTDVQDYYTYLAESDSLENLLVELEDDKKANKLDIRNLEREIRRYKRSHRVEFNLEQSEKAIKNVEIIFSESGAATCDILTKIFTPKFNENKEDIELLKKITKTLDKNECTETQLFSDASEQLYKLEPSPEAAYNIAKLFVKQGDFEKAEEYYKDAIKDEEDDLAKARYYYELSFIDFKLDKYQEARSNAYEAIKRKRDWGNPYIIIAMCYAASSKSCGTNEFERKAVFWAAVDKLIKAKRVDSSVSAQANRLIKSYSAHFPNNEDAFFYGYTDGKTYRVKCWINETTTVRTIKK